MKLDTNKKEWLTRILLVLMGVFAVGGLEFGLHLFNFGKEYNFVLEDEKNHQGRACLNTQYIALHYFQHLPVKLDAMMKQDPWFSDTEFTAGKDAGVFRIFMVGASTTRGFPFDGRSINYSHFLQLILQDILPSKRVEVLNAGYDALSSFGVLDITRKLAHYSPDMVVVYTGHNEFIGHFGVNSNINYGDQRWVADMVTSLHNSRLFLSGELLALKLRSRWKDDASRQGKVNLFRAMLSENQISWNQKTHKVALENYRENLLRIVKLAQNQGALAMVINPASNLRDFAPVLSLPADSLDAGAVKTLHNKMKEGRNLLEEGEYSQARNVFLQVLKRDPSYAHGHFYLGRALENLNDFSGARQEYHFAREFDRVHLRACSAMMQVAREVAGETQAGIIELEQVMEKISPNGLLGNNLFLEHVHPNVNGHFVIADTLARKIKSLHLPVIETSWDWSRLKSPREYISRAGYDARQFFNARYTIGRLLLDFPFFQCKEGETILTEINRHHQEQTLIRSCRNKSLENGLSG